jgi:hypothetical protein
LSENTRVGGHLELDVRCLVRAVTPCEAAFRLEADSGARWEGTYKAVTSDGGTTVHAVGRGAGDQANTQIEFDIQGLEDAVNGGDVWNGTAPDDNMIGRFVTSDSVGRCMTTMTTVC